MSALDCDPTNAGFTLTSPRAGPDDRSRSKLLGLQMLGGADVCLLARNEVAAMHNASHR